MNKKPYLILLSALLTLSPQAWSNYDPTKIRNGIDEQKKVFQVKDWQKNSKGWSVSSELPGLQISINENTTELILPFISPKQKQIAKERCEVLGNIGLSASTDIEREQIQKTIHDAARTHEIQTLDLNNTQLLVLPKLLGSYVRFYCKIKSNA